MPRRSLAHNGTWARAHDVRPRPGTPGCPGYARGPRPARADHRNRPPLIITMVLTVGKAARTERLHHCRTAAGRHSLRNERVVSWINSAAELGIYEKTTLPFRDGAKFRAACDRATTVKVSDLRHDEEEGAWGRHGRPGPKDQDELRARMRAVGLGHDEIPAGTAYAHTQPTASPAAGPSRTPPTSSTPTRPVTGSTLTAPPLAPAHGSASWRTGRF